MSLAVILSLTAQPAAASVGDSGTCLATGDVSHNNDWAYFWSRNIRAYEHVCMRMASVSGQNFMKLTYVRTPVITFPSRWPIPSGERVSLTQDPWVSYQGYTLGKLVAVTWTFSAKSCVAVCQDWDFKLRVTTFGTQLCVIGGSCDARKDW